MSRSLNKAILIGNVGHSPEVRSTGNGTRVASFTLATGKQWTDAQGNKQDKTEWHKCIAWNTPRGGGLADVVEKYVGKGAKLYVEGEIQYRQYQDKEGQTRYVTEINVKELLLLGGRDSGNAAGASSTSAPKSANKNTAPVDDFTDFPGALDGEDDDLPF